MIPIVTGSTKALTDHVRSVGHLASLIVVGGMLGAMTVYTGYTSKRRVKAAKGSCWYKWGPTFLVGVATCFIIADTVRHVLQDQGFWAEKPCRGFVGCGGSNQYQCADSTSKCCPFTGTYATIYNNSAFKTGGAITSVVTTGAHIDIPGSLVCDAGKGNATLDAYLAKQFCASCGPAGGPLSNRGQLEQLNFSPESVYDYFYIKLGTGCHSQEVFSCLGGMGTLFTAVFTYFGFTLLLWGSLWNANLIQKLSKAKDQWNQLRGNGDAVGVSKKLSAPVSSGARGSVASVGSDAEFKRLLASSSPVIVQFTASWCNPCKQIAPVFADLSMQYAASSGISFLKLDVDECEGSAEGVSSMPTFKYYKNGKEVESMAGADQGKLSRFVQKCAGGAAGTGDVESAAGGEEECTT